MVKTLRRRIRCCLDPAKQHQLRVDLQRLLKIEAKQNSDRRQAEGYIQKTVKWQKSKNLTPLIGLMKSSDMTIIYEDTELAEMIATEFDERFRMNDTENRSEINPMRVIRIHPTSMLRNREISARL